MAHHSLSIRTVMAGVAVALLLAALAASGLAGGQPAAADEHDDSGLTGAVDEVVDGMGDDEEDEQEAADDGGGPKEVVPDDGGGGGQEAAGEQPQQQSGGGEPAPEPASQEASGGSAPVPSGPRRAAGPRVNASDQMPEGAGASFDSFSGGQAFASAPEVFSEDDQGMARRPDELALASLPRENGPVNTAPLGGVPSELIAAATGLLVMVGAGHALFATRRLDDEAELAGLEPAGEGEGDVEGDADDDG